MGSDDVRRKLIEVAEDKGSSICDLRRQWIGEMYELGCLTHEKYLLLMGWIEAEEAVEMLDCQILDYHETMFPDPGHDSLDFNEDSHDFLPSQ
jgi:hypothetical protein